MLVPLSNFCFGGGGGGGLPPCPQPSLPTPMRLALVCLLFSACSLQYHVRGFLKTVTSFAKFDYFKKI